ncbi:hypothetical protein GIB67_021691 [Kingdonia uniflora]|uniref:Uncharacterized protein n=1 Tax=Kingdonia uniflora TaxID=39325 RepID=A0A7J7LLY4_9MAGN|nr:hypothetical protein GIB67_021691 [Kingdonia uniflora]
MTFSEVMDFNNKQSAIVGFDPVIVSMCPYAGTSWIGYDGPMSITLKIWVHSGLRTSWVLLLGCKW